MNQDLQKQLIGDFLLESFEGLDQFDQDLVLLEKGGSCNETLNRVFRVIHSIKGTAGCLGVQAIERVAHTGENLLSLLREARIAVTPEIISTLLTYADALREMLRNLERTGDAGNKDYSELLARIQRLQEPSGATGAAEDAGAAAGREPAKGGEADGGSRAAGVASGGVADPGWGLFDEAEATMVPAAAVPATAPASAAGASFAGRGSGESAGGDREVTGRGSITESAIRVDVGHLDKLMNLVGELVLARNQIVQHINASNNSTIQAVVQRLNLITTELQEGVMKTRMQPIDQIWSKLPRIVRDVAHELGKEVRLEMEGRQTELDRTIIEAIKDPLTHIIRNSVDHGIERPERRREAGKSAAGLLFLRAYHEGGQVNIEIMDDGAGINVARVKQKAVDRGQLTAEQAARMSDRDAFNLIFLPGLSTAEKISNVSGRGVGMDVVKTNIEKIGGSVDVQSEEGQGTTIKIKIPLTLAIIPALIVTSSGDRFAIPQVNLLELVRLEGGMGENGIENVFDAPVYRLRGKLLPLVFLNRVLGLEEGVGERTGVSNIVVLQADGRQFGLVVDAVNDTEEIVVKPLGKQLKGLTCFAGATIMGDGRVALILDVMGLAEHAQVGAVQRETRSARDARSEESGRGERQTLLVFSVGEHPRMAIPLSMAARLEEFSRGDVERAGNREVVQYRGQIMPLVRVSEYLNGGQQAAPADPMHVVVYSEQGRSVGLVVSTIDDIIEDTVFVEHRGGREGIAGSAVVQGRVTDLLDVKGVIRAAEPAFFNGSN